MILLNKFIRRYTDIISYAASKNIYIWQYHVVRDSYYEIFISSYKKRYYCELSYNGIGYVWLTAVSRLKLRFFGRMRQLFVDNAEVAKILAAYDLYSKHKDLIYVATDKCANICKAKKYMM